MAKTLLIVPGSQTFYGEPRYPVCGLSMIGAVLLEAGHQVRALDMRLSKISERHLMDVFFEFKPDYVGFTITNWDVMEAVRLAKLLKEKSTDIRVIFGGPQASLCPRQTASLEPVDYVVYGEGDITIDELLKALDGNEPLEKIKGLVYHNGQGEILITEPRPMVANLSELPWPAYDLFDLSHYRSFGENRLGIYSTRGCAFGCTFCTSKFVAGRKIRCREPDDVIKEMEYWNRHAGINHFCFLEDNLLGKHDHGRRFLEILYRSPRPFTYSLDSGVRADALTPEICSLLVKTGCTSIAIGIESVDPEVLKLCRKGETIEQISKGIRLAKAAGLFVKGYFIVGLPGDTAEKVKKAVQYAKDEEIDVPRFALAQAFPRTEMEAWVKDHGTVFYDSYEYILANTDEFHKDVHFELPGFPKKEIWKTFKWAHGQAEKISFDRALIRRFGNSLGSVLKIFNLKLVRVFIVWLYQKRLMSLPK